VLNIKKGWQMGFKVGDKVRVLGDSPSNRKGDVGLVKHASGGVLKVAVEGNSQDANYHPSHEVELVKESEKPKTGGGLRYNSGKAEIHQIPTSTFIGISKVLMYGAKKYEKNNFRKGMVWTIPYDCLMRHMFSWLDGQEVDEESGLSHLYHAAANIMMLIEYEKTCPELDDRFKGKKRGVDE
jgi:hypothetical protein